MTLVSIYTTGKHWRVQAGIGKCWQGAGGLWGSGGRGC